MLDPAEPVSIGAMVGPEAFMEVRYLAHAKQMQALELIPQIAAEFAERFGRDSGGLLHPYRCEDAETIVVALGSVLGTIADVVDEQREQGVKVGALGIGSFRPFPLDAVREALAGAQRVVVLEKALAVGIGGIVSANVRMAHVRSSTCTGTPSSPAWAGGRSPRGRCTPCSPTLRRTGSTTSPSSTWTRTSWTESCSDRGNVDVPVPRPRTCLRDVGAVAAGPV